jgi:hypothetical protein
LSYLTGNFLVAILTTGKYLLLKFPLRVASWTRRTAHQLCNLALIPPFVIMMSMLTVDKDDVAFDYKIYSCSYGLKADVWKYILPLNSIIFCLPNFIIVVQLFPL